MSKRLIHKLVKSPGHAAGLVVIKRRIDVLQRRYTSKVYVKANYQERLVKELEELIDVFVKKVHEAKAHEVH